MSMKEFASLPPFYVPDLRRDFWARMFGYSVLETREAAGLSVEAAAQLAGMEVCEWAAVEDGHVPQDPNLLRAMAAALGLRFDQIAGMAMVCREAWEL